MRFGTWNVRNMYMAGLLTAAGELERHKLDLVGVLEVR
jgi:predicted translin family RNA/ssDNA-binding protein